jgi:hypothetical protein
MLRSRLTSRNLGESINNRPFTPLLGSVADIVQCGEPTFLNNSVDWLRSSCRSANNCEQSVSDLRRRRALRSVDHLRVDVQSCVDLGGAVSTDILHRPVRVVALLRSASCRRAAPNVLEELSGVSERSMIHHDDHERLQQRYDHRLRDLVQRTGDMTIATDLGVPRSTVRGCSARPRRPS